MLTCTEICVGVGIIKYSVHEFLLCKKFVVFVSVFLGACNENDNVLSAV